MLVSPRCHLLADAQQETEKEAWQRQERNVLSLKQVLEIVQGGSSSSITVYASETGRTKANATARLLWNLAKRVQSGVPAQYKDAVTAAVISLVDDLTAIQRRSPPGTAAQRQPGPQPVLAQLDPHSLALAVWAASKLRHPRAHVQQFCTAVIQHITHSSAVMHSSVLDRFDYVDWARLVYGLAGAGFRCDRSQGLEQIFSRAASYVVRGLAQEHQEEISADAQSISNIYYAGAKAGARNVDWLQYVVAVIAAHAAGKAMTDANTQDWANMLWACKQLKVYDAAFLSTAAQALAQQAESAKSQDVSNALHALAHLGWYDPAVYDALIAALLGKTNKANDQDYSNAVYACALAQHVTDEVQQLARAALDYSDVRDWDAQAVCNTLLSCVALQAYGSADVWGKAAPIFKLSQALFTEASERDASAYDVLDLSQLHRAQCRTLESGRPGLSAGKTMLATVQQGRQEYLQSLLHRPMLQLQHEANIAAASIGRYRCIRPCIIGNNVLAQGEIQHSQTGHSLAVYALETGKYFRHPLGRLTGMARLLVDDLAACFPAVVLVYEHEWEALKGDPDAQKAFMDTRLQQAEAAIAAAQQQQQRQQGGDGGAGAGRPAPIIIGLMPQDHPNQPRAYTQQAESADSTVTTTPEPPAPKLSSSEAQARLKELDQKQQTLFQGLPPALSNAPTGGIKSPAQQQPLRPAPQAPMLKPPRRPGA
jgi:hypothetical protein